ncbi:hypothetical protein [Synechococcus sp. BA-132 BA5]|nr:hypothetical protein [Synechococcus sp. BA-132 BA5]MEA5417199.1 hypothetical protein [Synechococcus sp. BA-132 BA5]
MLTPSLLRPHGPFGSAFDRLQHHLHHTRLLGSISSVPLLRDS